MIYKYSGYPGVPIAVNLEIDGATVAVVQSNGAIHPDYVDNSLALQWMADTPNWQEIVAALPQPEPEPEPGPAAKWLEFYNSLIVSAPYHHIREVAKIDIRVNLFYTDLAGNLTAAIAGMPNSTGFQYTYNDLKSAIISIDAGLTQEELDTLQTLGSSCNIPINW